jgi:hypothetical protein
MTVPGQNDLLPRLGPPDQLCQLPLGLGHRHFHGLLLHGLLLNGPSDGLISSENLDRLMDQIKPDTQRQVSLGAHAASFGAA